MFHRTHSVLRSSFIAAACAATLLLAAHTASGQVIAISRELTVYGEPIEIVPTAGVLAISRDLTVQGYPCCADLHDGATEPPRGRADGGVEIADLLFFLDCYGDGRLCADVNDGSNSCTPDGGVTIEDLLYFLERYLAGC